MAPAAGSPRGHAAAAGRKVEGKRGGKWGAAWVQGPVYRGTACSLGHRRASSRKGNWKVLALSERPPSGQDGVRALIDESSAGYQSDIEQYSRPPRWLKQLESEEDETRVLNQLVNVSCIVGLGIAFGFKFFTIDADVWRGWTLTEILATVPKDNWRFYEVSLASHPIISKACISGFVYGLGDLTAQTYEGRSLDRIDRGRMVRSSLTGFIGHGPLSHWWYITADQLCAPLGDGFTSIAAKLLLDQTLWAFIWLFAYYSLLGCLHFDTPAKTFSTMKVSWWPVLKAGWRFWPFAHMITYGVIPQRDRLLWVDVCEIVWVTILSYIGNAKRKEAQQTSQEAIEMGEEAAGPVGVMGQVSCTLPTAQVGGSPAEEILRSMETERLVCLDDGTEETCAPAEVLFSSGCGSQDFDAGDLEAIRDNTTNVDRPELM